MQKINRKLADLKEGAHKKDIRADRCAIEAIIRSCIEFRMTEYMTDERNTKAQRLELGVCLD